MLKAVLQHAVGFCKELTDGKRKQVFLQEKCWICNDEPQESDEELKALWHCIMVPISGVILDAQVVF